MENNNGVKINPAEDTLTEEIEPYDEKVVVTYVRAK